MYTCILEYLCYVDYDIVAVAVVVVASVGAVLKEKKWNQESTLWRCAFARAVLYPVRVYSIYLVIIRTSCCSLKQKKQSIMVLSEFLFSNIVYKKQYTATFIPILGDTDASPKTSLRTVEYEEL